MSICCQRPFGIDHFSVITTVYIMVLNLHQDNWLHSVLSFPPILVKTNYTPDLPAVGLVRVPRGVYTISATLSSSLCLIVAKSSISMASSSSVSDSSLAVLMAGRGGRFSCSFVDFRFFGFMLGFWSTSFALSRFANLAPRPVYHTR